MSGKEREGERGGGRKRERWMRERGYREMCKRLRSLKGLSHEIDFKNVVENGPILALIRAAAGL